MENDDRQIGQILSRRDALKLMGLTGAALLAGCVPGASELATSTAAPASTGAGALPACVVRPELTEGPYFVDEDLDRSDIRSDPATGAVSEGVPLALTFNVSRVSGGACTRLPGAKVDVWHCDARGIYSDVQDPNVDTTGQKFLRGYQVTDANGQAGFVTIYPGWYSGRTVHIHFKVREDSGREFTSQLFFDDLLSDQVFAQAPYAARGQRNVLNSDDRIYDGMLVLDVTQVGEGYVAAFDIGLA